MTYYKDDATIFCKVVCTHCGSDTELMHVNLSAIDENKKIHSHDTVICRSCYRDLPEREDDSDE